MEGFVAAKEAADAADAAERMQMYAKHALACTLYVKRLIHMSIMVSWPASGKLKSHGKRQAKVENFRLFAVTARIAPQTLTIKDP